MSHQITPVTGNDDPRHAPMTSTVLSSLESQDLVKASRPWLVLVINDNVILYVTNVCFAEINGKLGRMTGKTIPEIRTRSDG